jgi:cobalamin biosynthetic protein CobC
MKRIEGQVSLSTNRRIRIGSARPLGFQGTRTPTPHRDPATISLPEHGGDILHAEQQFGAPKKGWLDLSTGINPAAYPLPELNAESWQKLPERRREDAALDAACRYYGVPDKTNLVHAPGTQALIQWLPWLREPGPVAIVGPTYTEHANAWRAAGHEATVIDGLPGWGDFPVVVITNPNNPDGKRHAPETLLALAEAQAFTGGLLVIDEAFADLCPEVSLAAKAGMEGICVLRSFGKFFGLGGLRLGFALADNTLADELRRALGPWPVSGPALDIAAKAFSDTGWIESTRRALAERAERLDGILQQHDFEILGGTDLFRLACHGDARAVYLHLAAQGILTRAFEDRPERLRFGLPADDEGFERLDAALGRFSR